jgi:NADPH-dependent F420 reductase
VSSQGTLIRIAVLGGTGKEGGGLAFRWARAGYDVIIGSRQAEKAERAAAELNERLGDEIVRGMRNDEAAAEADIVVLTVPYSAHKTILESVRQAVQGKVLVDVTVPLKPPDTRTAHIPEGRSAAEEAQALLGEGVRVVSAFQNISSTHLSDESHLINCDVLICGDDAEAKQDVEVLAKAAGMRGVDAGPLANAVAAEALTPVLLSINKRYGVKKAGIRITGLGQP